MKLWFKPVGAVVLAGAILSGGPRRGGGFGEAAEYCAGDV